MTPPPLDGKGRPLVPGKDVDLHPAEDLWMRGVTRGVIVAVGPRFISFRSSTAQAGRIFRIPVARAANLNPKDP